MADNVDSFISELARSLRDETFVKMSLGNYKGADPHLQKLLIRLIKTRKGIRLFFLYRSDTRDTVKNFDFEEGIEVVRGLLGTEFFSGHLFTTAKDFQLDVGKRGNARLNTAKPTFKGRISLEHDREKQLSVDPGSFYLKALGITTDHGGIRDKQQDKWKQINKFVEIIAGLVDRSSLSGRKELSIVDMGSGKGYLTFAAYDYFRNIRGLDVSVTGVDTKIELISFCNEIGRSSDFEGLNFVPGGIDTFDLKNVDILIALHACNTATDDAIYKGISAGAELIIAAPCCHQEPRPQIRAPEIFRDILKHGTLLERTAEMITDGLRSLLMERSGYSTKIFEFVSVDHTPKNSMIVGTRSSKPQDPARFDHQIDAIKEFYGIQQQRLESLLSNAALGKSTGTG
jgi:SAM-dependent methyltransferase